MANMLFYNKQTNSDKEKYIKLLSMMGSLSNLFSVSNIPYLDSRVAENVFCISLNAENIARQDCTADAKKGKIGIGIKTYIATSPLQKIAEFNKANKDYKNLKADELVNQISVLRNERIKFTMREYGLDQLLYHCITRKEHEFTIQESYMDEIDINSLKIISSNDKSIKFKDKYNEYSFLYSKSVLMKKFYNMKVLEHIKINIITDPYTSLLNYFNNIDKNILISDNEKYDYIILPLYHYNSKGIKEISKKSGLNQWNAGGRKRHPDEVYISISKKDHKYTPNFFPNKNIVFNLFLPNGKKMKAKICQYNDKALMSNPNKDLGKWILRDVLNLKERVLITYDLLENLGIDSVKIEKINDENYRIFFASVGSYEEFLESKKHKE